MEQSSNGAGKRHIITETLVWEGVTLSIAYEPSWLAASEDYGPAHSEIRVVAPEGAPLPITETGYRSHFLARGTVEEARGPVAYVRAWLDEAALEPEWKQAQSKRAQQVCSRRRDVWKRMPQRAEIARKIDCAERTVLMLC